MVMSLYESLKELGTATFKCLHDVADAKNGTSVRNAPPRQAVPVLRSKYSTADCLLRHEQFSTQQTAVNNRQKIMNAGIVDSQRFTANEHIG